MRGTNSSEYLERRVYLGPEAEIQPRTPVSLLLSHTLLPSSLSPTQKDRIAFQE